MGEGVGEGVGEEQQGRQWPPPQSGGGEGQVELCTLHPPLPPHPHYLRETEGLLEGFKQGTNKIS